MASRMILLCHAPTAAMRIGAFASPDDPLDPDGLRKAGSRSRVAPDDAVVVYSPALAARQTAATMRIEGAVDTRLGDMAFGSWSGLSFAEVGERDPGGLSCWLADPALGSPDGESLAAVVRRVTPWLESAMAGDRTVLAITHPMTVRALLASALDLPPAATMRIDIAPLSATALSFNGIWRLQAIERARS